MTTAWRARVARTGAVLGDRIARADSFAARFLGLMGRSSLATGEGLLLTETASIHMGFMRFAIDVVFLDDASRVVAVKERVRPWFGFAAAPASSALELPAGTARACGLAIGDEVTWERASTHDMHDLAQNISRR